MAFVDPNQTNQSNQTSQSSLPPAGITSTQAPSSASGVGAPSAQTSYSPSAPTTGTAGTGFQNLNAYLDANQGNTLGSQLAGKISTQANQSQNDLRNAQTGFQQQVDQNTVQQNPNNMNSVLSNPNQASAADTAAFQAQLNANYGGPTDVNNYGSFSSARNEAQDAYNKAQQAQTQGGKAALLDEYFSNPNYTQGQKGLDSALLMGGDQAPFQNLEQQVQNYPSQFQSVAQDLNNYASKGAATTAATRAAARSALGIDDAGNLVKASGTDQYGNPIYTGAIGNIENAVNQTVGQDNATTPQVQADILSALQKGDTSTLTPAEKADLGQLVNFQGRTWGANPTDYLSNNAVNATAATAITPQQQAQLQALYGLAGLTNTFAPNASQAGTVANPVNFNYDAFQQKVNQGQADYLQALNAPQFNNGATGTTAVPDPFLGGGDTLASQYAYAQSQVPIYNQELVALPGQPGSNVTQLGNEIMELSNAYRALQNQYGYNDYLNQTPDPTAPLINSPYVRIK